MRQEEVLTILREDGGWMTPKDICQRAGRPFDPSSCHYALKSLTVYGFIEKDKWLEGGRQWVRYKVVTE